ncbi:uncharacterized protein LOC123888059 [Trifolium pratense]|uniref:uncharacterized protein LOC123888059 n=1 Tax=Trifolium pratense TaxID=57577 RepID=UPI001E696D54|nr:uncharacterized protein LOC123888056 isoform X2 [Trifolium pratense]XP_045792965.1 uncharacterized protein LOC123888056 isoform X2 [Trifolium pratense]XP_045792966.1 uncharacterized protein LOC123888056 isoform X2 [Trifolium pratense]XP_045792969.1 uncharacterized protein LOC123888059 [Trifolium pratense]
MHWGQKDIYFFFLNFFSFEKFLSLSSLFLIRAFSLSFLTVVHDEQQEHHACSSPSQIPASNHRRRKVQSLPFFSSTVLNISLLSPSLSSSPHPPQPPPPPTNQSPNQNVLSASGDAAVIKITLFFLSGSSCQELLLWQLLSLPSLYRLEAHQNDIELEEW